MNFRMIQAVIKCLKVQQSRELRRIRTTSRAVYLYNKTAVRFKPRIKAHGYSHCPTALLLLFLSLCES